MSDDTKMGVVIILALALIVFFCIVFFWAIVRPPIYSDCETFHLG